MGCTHEWSALMIFDRDWESLRRNIVGDLLLKNLNGGPFHESENDFRRSRQTSTLRHTKKGGRVSYPATKSKWATMVRGMWQPQAHENVSLRLALSNCRLISKTESSMTILLLPCCVNTTYPTSESLSPMFKHLEWVFSGIEFIVSMH